jgi:hypothetical protein
MPREERSPEESPEERAERLLGIARARRPPGIAEPVDLAEAIDIMAAEFEAPRAVVLAEVVAQILKAVQVARLRRLTSGYVEE